MMKKEATDRDKNERRTDGKPPVGQQINIEKADATEYKRSNQSNADETVAQPNDKKDA